MIFVVKKCALLTEFPDGLADAVEQGDLRFPAEGMGERGIEQFTEHAIGFGWIPRDFAVESGFVGDGFGEGAYGDFGAGAGIDQVRWKFRLADEKEYGVGEIIDMHEFAPGVAGSPQGDLGR